MKFLGIIFIRLGSDYWLMSIFYYFNYLGVVNLMIRVEARYGNHHEFYFVFKFSIFLVDLNKLVITKFIYS